MIITSVILGLAAIGSAGAPAIEWELALAPNAPFVIAEAHATQDRDGSIDLTLTAQSSSGSPISDFRVFVGVFDGVSRQGGIVFSAERGLDAGTAVTFVHKFVRGKGKVDPAGTVVLAPAEARFSDRMWKVSIDTLQRLTPKSLDIPFSGETVDAPTGGDLNCTICDNCFMYAMACGQRVNGMGYCTGSPCITSFSCTCYPDGSGDCSFTCKDTGCC
jgi:hypothetical protein